MISLLPYSHAHLALLQVQARQSGDAERFGAVRGAAAELGPAFTAAETDADGHIVKLLCCAGLVENAPDYATAWAVFAEGLRPRQWAALAAMIRGVLDASGYRRIDMMTREGFDAAERFARHLGFAPDARVYARSGGPAFHAMFHEKREAA